MTSQEEQAKLLESYQQKIEDLEHQIRVHERELVSRIVMSKKEEIAREAMIAWLEEEIESLEEKLAATPK